MLIINLKFVKHYMNKKDMRTWNWGIEGLLQEITNWFLLLLCSLPPGLISEAVEKV